MLTNHSHGWWAPQPCHESSEYQSCCVDRAKGKREGGKNETMNWPTLRHAEIMLHPSTMRTAQSKGQYSSAAESNKYTTCFVLNYIEQKPRQVVVEDTIFCWQYCCCCCLTVLTSKNIILLLITVMITFSLSLQTKPASSSDDLMLSCAICHEKMRSLIFNHKDRKCLLINLVWFSVSLVLVVYDCELFIKSRETKKGNNFVNNHE